MELLPTRARYSPGDQVEIEVRSFTGPAEATVWNLGEQVARLQYTDGLLNLGALAEGTYGVELTAEGQTIRTAIDVSADSRHRLRYGFVVDYTPGRDLAAVSDNIRRLHLTGIQFYDWAYRHASLLGGGEEYRDALNQPIALDTVRRLITAVQQAGSRALGYAAVYAVGPDDWPEWQHRALLTPEGAPYALGDFLFLIDPAAKDWLVSFTGQLTAASEHLGFDGYHLDQYGYPKRAVRADGVSIAVASSFTTMIGSVREALPGSHLVFNNVNDFPTWATATSPQDAIYIEVWPPHVTLGSLGAVVTRARSVGGSKPVVIAAYQHVYDSTTAARADLATAFTMAALFSHGATQLLAGEGDRVLVDPYYVRNHAVESSTAALLTRWYDFSVEHDALLFDPAIVDVTGALAGLYNDDCDVMFQGIDVTVEATAGAVWRRITSVNDRLVVHLINLVGQDDQLWDAPRNEPAATGTGTLRLRRVGNHMPRVRIADPDNAARLVGVEVLVDGDFATVTLPQFQVWQLVVIDLEPIEVSL